MGSDCISSWSLLIFLLSTVNLPVPINMLVLCHIILEIPLLSFTHSARVRTQNVPFSNDSTRTMCPFSECPPAPFSGCGKPYNLCDILSVPLTKCLARSGDLSFRPTREWTHLWQLFCWLGFETKICPWQCWLPVTTNSGVPPDAEILEIQTLDFWTLVSTNARGEVVLVSCIVLHLVLQATPAMSTSRISILSLMSKWFFIPNIFCLYIFAF